MPAHNKRFAKLGGKVIIRTLACPITVSDNPNGVQLIPNFAKHRDVVRQQRESGRESSRFREESTARERSKVKNKL